MAAAVTPADLIERLRGVLHVRTDEELAARLGVPLRSLSNYKKGQNMGFARTVELLELAGWLSIQDGTPSARTKINRARRVAAELATQAEALAEILGQ